MKVTKFIPLTFTASPNTTAYISVPFRVKTIHVKSAGYVAGSLPGPTRYVVISSDLVRNNPLAMVFQDTTYSSATVQDIYHKYENPIDVNGNYNFTIFAMNGAVSQTSNGGAGTDTAGLIIEFDSADELI